MKTSFFRRNAKGIYDFFNPPFTTSDFENAHTKTSADYQLSSIVFNENRIPKLVKGTVTHTKGLVEITTAMQWDKYGKCRTLLGQRKRSFDLVRNARKTILQNRIAAEATIMVLIIILLNLFSN
jgi:hypothetical protein